MGDITQSRIQSFAFVVSACVAACFSLILILNNPEVENYTPANKINLESRVNPNFAPIASLVRLPDIGLLRAAAIVTYREQFSGTNRAFQDIHDLQKVKGIGPKTSQNISQWLTFE